MSDALVMSPTALLEVKLIEPRIFRDDRGAFFESYSRARYQAAGLPGDFAQDNVSTSGAGVLRGLHYQHPRAQGKLVSVLRGTVLDVAVDIRRGSPTFGRWVAVELSAEDGRQLYIPEGFAHGFLVLEAPAVFHYKCTAPYDPSSEGSVIWNDPDLGIPWPSSSPRLSPKDAAAPRLSAIAEERLPPLRGPLSDAPMPTLLAETTADGRWRPGIGDPTVLGWATVAAYLVAAWLAIRAAYRDRGAAFSLPFSFWGGIAVVLLALGLNKQLDLQSWLTQFGRDLAKAQGWYGDRRRYQGLFLLAVAVAALAGVWASWSKARGSRARRMAVLGLACLAAFILARASSIHALDAVLGLRLLGSRWGALLELAGVVAVGVAARSAASRPGRS